MPEKEMLVIRSYGKVLTPTYRLRHAFISRSVFRKRVQLPCFYACCKAVWRFLGTNFSNSGYDLGFTHVSSCG
jgi:hypothetical protein